MPLQCKTEKICLTDSKSNCEKEFGKKSKDNLITVVELPDDPEAAKYKVLDVYADSLYYCNWMLGEGNLNFLPTPSLSKNNYCIICARIVMDKNVSKNLGFDKGIKYSDLYYLMENKKDKNERSYLEAVYPGKTSSDLLMVFINLTDKIKNKEVKDFNLDISNVEFSVNNWVIFPKTEQTVIASIIVKPALWSTLTGPATAVFTGGALWYVGVAGIIGFPATLIGSAVVGGIVYIKYLPNQEGGYQYPNLVPYNSDFISGLQCDYFENQH